MRLGLQRRAPGNLRRHAQRAAVRFVALVICDLAAFWLMRALLRAVRDDAVFGSRIAEVLRSFLPVGYLSGWQFASALFLGLIVLGNYGPGDRRRNSGRLFLACALAAALPLWAMVWEHGLEVVLLQYAFTTLLVWLGVLAERLTIDHIVRRFRNPERDATHTLFVGRGDECKAVAASPAFGEESEYRPIGFVDTESPSAVGALGTIGDLPILLAASGAEAVVICGFLTDAQLREVVDMALTDGCQVLSVPRVGKVAGVHPTTVWRQGQPLVQLTAPSLKGQQLFVKRAVDLLGAACGLLVVGPLMAFVALAIKLDSPGPILFGQERIGTGGRRFRVWKFRTMVHGASDAAHRALVLSMMAGDEATTAATDRAGQKVYKLVADDRVTRIGRLLRGTSLDELPQLFNVIIGQMSLVGPRPPLPYEFEAYDHWQFDRLRVLPGITGLWQVSGRNRLSYRQMCELDVDYVRRWSLWLDVKILFRTIPVVFFNSGRAA